MAILLAVLTILWPSARAHVRAAALLTRLADSDSLAARIGRLAVREHDLALPQTRARLYMPTGVDAPPALVVVHGVHFKGIDEPRLLRFARAIAATGIAVLTPEVRELCDYHIDPASIDTIGESALVLSRELKRRSVGVIGLSFGGGLALVAATDPRFRAAFSFVAAVGAHDDLGRVLRFFISNEARRPDGTVMRLAAHPYGPAVLVYSHAPDFFPPEDVRVATETLLLWLKEDFDAARSHAAALSPKGAREMRYIFDRDTAALSADLSAEIEKLAPSFDAVSPSAHLAELGVPVFLLHGAGDNVIPSSETEWLARHTPAPLRWDVLVSPAIEHVELEGEIKLGEKLALLNFMSALLEACDEELP
jgi:dienelactone hydrolase